MSDLANIQERISSRLRKLSANDLQRLAEELALILRPSTFSRATLVVQGRNIENQTTKGWPDAYAEAPGGGVYAIEATRQKGSWKKHVEEDLIKATDGINRMLAGYFFVGGYPDHEPTAKTKSDWIRKFAAIGIAPENISLLVGLDLVTVLMAPECARIRQTILRLSVAPRRFRLLRAGAVNREDLDPSQPSSDDYKNRRVFEPSLLPEVVSGLKSKGQVLIRGHGAAGKTTLAHLLSASTEIDPSPVYYVDLGAISESLEYFCNEAVEDFAEFAGPGVIFIVDNIHLAESLVRDLVQEWLAVAKPLKAGLLLLGREQRTRHGTGLGDLKPLVMRAGAPELRGVVRRLLEREDYSIPEISNAQLREWIAVFGGDPNEPSTSVDLIAFSAAAGRRLSALAAGNFHLKPEDAVDGVRARYWSPIKQEAERANLLRLAALAILEVAAVDGNLPRPDFGFPTSSSQGFVFSSPIGGEGRVQHSLAHPALGNLLLHAAGVIDGGRVERCSAARAQASLAFRLAALAADDRERRELTKIALASVDDSRWLSSTSTLHDIVSTARALLRAKVISARDLDHTLSQSADFVRILLGTRAIENWIQLLSMAKHRELTQTLKLMRGLTSGEANFEQLIGMVIASAAHLVAAFLKLHPAGNDILSKIDVRSWNSVQVKRSRAIFVGEAVSAMNFFESKNRMDLARAPADRQVLLAEPQLWVFADMTHLSHTIRTCTRKETDIEGLLIALSGAGWLDNAVDRTTSGRLTGALLSLSNHLPTSLFELLPLAALETRLKMELRTKLQDSGEPALRALSMLGTATELIPAFRPPLDIVWPSTQTITAMISARVRKDDLDQLGTHEIQLWLGLMRMAEAQSNIVDIDGVQGNRILRLLANTKTPTDQAEAIRVRLTTWLERCASQNWRT
jgi:hypothetical protein